MLEICTFIPKAKYLNRWLLSGKKCGKLPGVIFRKYVYSIQNKMNDRIQLWWSPTLAVQILTLDFLFYQEGNKDRDFRAGVAHEKNWERGDFVYLIFHFFGHGCELKATIQASCWLEHIKMYITFKIRIFLFFLLICKNSLYTKIINVLPVNQFQIKCEF